jgi:hypothetical protein
MFLPEPFAPWNHIQQCLHEGEIFPKPTIIIWYGSIYQTVKTTVDNTLTILQTNF